MQTLTEVLSSAEFWKIALPALAAIGAWFLNERSKLAWEQYKRKEENYKELLRCLKGFYVSTQDRELKNHFLHQINLLWIYAPDPVIRAGYAFLDNVKAGVSASDREKELACGVLVEQSPRFVPAHGKTVVLELRGHAATAIARPRLRRDRLHPSP
jgi:hypothetical protein